MVLYCCFTQNELDAVSEKTFYGGPIFVQRINANQDPHTVFDTIETEILNVLPDCSALPPSRAERKCPAPQG
jgi:hypothetical protein